MKFREAPLAGVYVIEQERIEDPRGFFARIYCAGEYTDRGLDPRIAQASVSHNVRRGTLRGLHFQAAPHSEAKTVRCLQGAVYDVVADLRPGSKTRNRWFGTELRADLGNAIYIPSGCAHGFVTLADESALEYLISEPYRPECARGVRYDDVTLGIDWPLTPTVISQRDRELPTLVSLQDEI